MAEARVWLDKRTAGKKVWCIIWTDPTTQKRHRERTAATTKNEAMALLNAQQSRIVRADVAGKPLEATNLRPFDAFLDEFMKAEEKKVGESNGYTPSTFADFKYKAEAAKEWFGSLPVQHISRKTIKDFYADMVEEKESPATANRHLSFVSTILSAAMDKDLIEYNPARGVQKEREHGFRLRYYSQHEANHILPFLPSWMRPMFTLALHCGLRRSELCQLTWADVDFLAKRITIREAKNRKVQTVPMNEIAYSLLEELKPAAETWQKSAYVFSDSKGEPWTATSVSHAYKAAAEAAGISGTTFHTTRHTCASWMVQRGVPIKAVSEILRHGSMDVTMRYAHLGSEHLDAAVAVLTKPEEVTKKATG